MQARLGLGGWESVRDGRMEVVERDRVMQVWREIDT